MSAYKRMLYACLGLGFALQACTPDAVQPRDASEQEPKIGLLEEHPLLTPFCSRFDTLPLISEDGSLTVNYCRPSPCAVPQAPWGNVEVYNTDSLFVATFSLGVGWFIDLSSSEFALTNSFNFNQNGIPISNQDWFSYTINPRSNSWQLVVNKNDIQRGGDNCFAFAANITVMRRISFVAGWDLASTRRLWVYNSKWNEPGPQQSNSPYVDPWCWGFCPPPAADTLCATVRTGLPTSAGNAGCATLAAPSVTTLSSSALTYAWSNGATTPSISACAPGQYTVSITEIPSRVPVAVYAFEVSGSNVECSSGNSPHHKVWVCHIPPGNPNNPQDICIDWSGVPAHVARFRAPGANPNQGHDSGCEIGKCGSSNPCQ
jgi:hypothetical protein